MLKNQPLSCLDTVLNLFSVYMLILPLFLHIIHSSHPFNIITVNEATQAEIMAKVLDTGQKNSEIMLRMNCQDAAYSLFDIVTWMAEVPQDKTLYNCISTFKINIRLVCFLEVLIPKYKPVNSMDKLLLQMSHDSSCWHSSKFFMICFNNSVIKLKLFEI